MMKLLPTRSFGLLLILAGLAGMGTAKAAVIPSTLTNFPAPPTIFDDIYISIDLTTNSGSAVDSALTWFRVGTNGVFDSIAMTNSGSHWTTVTPISHPDFGALQYTVQYFTNGSQYVFFPSGGTSSPGRCTVNLPFDGRSESFDTNWPGAPWGSITPRYSNAVNNLTGWSVTNVNIRAGTTPSPYSTPYSATFQPSSYYSWFDSATITSEISAISFMANNNSSANSATLGIESFYEGATDPVTNITKVIAATTTWQSYTITNILNPTSNQVIRLRKYNADSAAIIFLDNVAISHPPASVTITNVFINPGYPSTSDTVKVSCEITSANPRFPAYNMAPTVYYRPANSSAWSNRPMVRVSGNRFETPDTGLIPTFGRDTEVKYFIRCDFNGYHGSSLENRSPQFHPTGSSNNPLSYMVRAFATSYSSAVVVVNGEAQPTRLLSDRVWQSVATLTSTSTTFSLSFLGNGYSAGLGYSTNVVIWGQSNVWQTALPLADTAGIGQTNLSITGTFPPAQYVVRFNELTGEYVVQECAWQDFDSWAGTAGKYVKSVNSGVAMTQNNFDSWPTNEVRTRTEAFSDDRWKLITSFTNKAAGGDDEFAIFGSKIDTSVGNPAPSVLGNTTGTKGDRFVVQASRMGSYPLRGIGTITYQYRVVSTNKCDIALYFFTNAVSSGNEYLSWPDWIPSSGFSTNFGVTNTGGFVRRDLPVRTNCSYDVIFSQNAGNEGVYFDEISVSEWYGSNITNSGWVAQEAFVERQAVFPYGNFIKLEPTRADPFGTDQFIQTPALTNGINTFSFSFSSYYTNSPVSFDIQISLDPFDIPVNWSNLASVASNSIPNAPSNFVSVSQTLMLDKYSYPKIFLRVKSTTPAPGALLLDDFKISAYGGATEWKINNCAVDDRDQTFPPGVRQFYAGAAYINSNRVSDISTNATDRPNTNVFPSVTSPVMERGIGEISFWYRNWATSGVPTAAKLIIQTSTIDSTNNADWATVGMLTNVVNTNDYVYYRTSVYEPNSRYVRIYNNDAQGSLGRACIDDLLVTTPIAASLSVSNLVTSPTIPLFSNEVDVVADVYRLFLFPSNVSLIAYYSTGTTYEAAVAGPFTARAMNCIQTNTTVPGKWYRYQTTSSQRIPVNSADTFVAYFVRASFEGQHSDLVSPITNKTFGVYPAWLAPMPEITNNTAFYVVYSCPTGSVWINEFNVVDWEGTMRYVELCGVAGASIRNWRLEVMNGSGTTNAIYAITNGSPLANSTNGFGFWVIGNDDTPSPQMTLTNDLPAPNGGLRLLRPCGAQADALSYGLNAASVATLTNKGFTYIGLFDDDWWDYPVALTGSNTTGFVWSNTGDYSHSPGGINLGQYLLVASPTFVEPDIRVVGFWVNTNVWIRSTRTNSWYPTAWYSTNLPDSNAWAAVPAPVFIALTSTNALINFVTPTNNPAVFYRIKATNGP